MFSCQRFCVIKVTEQFNVFAAEIEDMKSSNTETTYNASVGC